MDGGGFGGSPPGWFDEDGCGAWGVGDGGFFPPFPPSGDGGETGGGFGSGLPPSGMPSPGAIVARFTLQNAQTNPSYVLTLSDNTGFVTGSLTVTVQFLVNGQAVVAPMSFGGNVTVNWTTSGSGNITGLGAWSQSGNWSLAVTGANGTQVLNGSESHSDPLASASSSATNFTLSPNAWPSGTLSSSLSIAGTPIDESITESFNGTNIVTLSGTRGGTAFGPIKIDMTTGQQVH